MRYFSLFIYLLLGNWYSFRELCNTFQCADEPISMNFVAQLTTSLKQYQEYNILTDWSEMLDQQMRRNIKEDEILLE
jgi:hypothetical protein